MKPSTFARLYVAGYATFTGRLDRKGAGQHRGCRANQDTAAMVPAAGLEIDRLERCDCPATAPRFCRPHISGEARPAPREGARET